jgi:hypothetical protein
VQQALSKAPMKYLAWLEKQLQLHGGGALLYPRFLAMT